MTPFSQNYASALRADALKEIATWADVAEEGCRVKSLETVPPRTELVDEANKWAKLGELLAWAAAGAAPKEVGK